MTAGRHPRRRVLAGGAVALALAGLLGTAARDETARFLVLDDPPGPCDAIVVMAGDPDYERTTSRGRPHARRERRPR